jgi:hypothetical protein
LEEGDYQGEDDDLADADRECQVEDGVQAANRCRGTDRTRQLSDTTEHDHHEGLHDVIGPDERADRTEQAQRSAGYSG